MNADTVHTEPAMDPVTTTGDRDHRQVSVSRDGQTRATADIDGTQRPELVRAALHADGGPLPDTVGRQLVDAVLDLPEIAESSHMQASMPAADGSMAGQIREHFDDVQTRLAGATVVLDATQRHSESGASTD